MHFSLDAKDSLRYDCRYGWRRWGACNSTCTPNSGYPPATRFRDIVCLFNNVKVIDDSYCDNNLLARPGDWELCNTFPCDRYVFRLGEWSDCSTTCGQGVRTRSVECLDSKGQYVCLLYCCCL